MNFFRSNRNIVDDAGASEGDFTKFWGDVSRSLRIVDLELRTTKYEYDGKTYLAVVNNAANGVAKLATRLTPEQIALFRVTLDEILKTDESAKDGLDVMEALNFTVDAAQTSQRAMSQDDPAMSQMQLKLTSVGAMTKKQKEETIGVLVNDGWLGRTRDGKRLVLGPRAFCELRTFILEQAPEGARARWDMNL